MYNPVDALIVTIKPEDYEIDEAAHRDLHRGRHREDRGHAQGRDLLKGESLYDVENVAMVHPVNNALKAHRLFQRDKDYIVRNGEIVIIDEISPAA